MTRSFSNVYRALEGQHLGETEKAVKFKLHAPGNIKDGEIQWYPLSQITSIHRCYDEIEGTFDVLMISEWLLGQKGLLSASLSTNPATKNAPTVPAKSEAEKKYDKMKHNRLPYKDDEGPVIQDDDIPF